MTKSINCRYLINKLTSRLINFLNEQLNIKTKNTHFILNNIEKMQLNSVTTLINVEWQVKVIVLISYQQALFDEIFTRYTDGLFIDKNEKEDALIDSAGDIINIVVGNTLAEIKNQPHAIIMSLPLLIKDKRQITCKHDTLFYQAKLITELGQLDIYLISNTIGEINE